MSPGRFASWHRLWPAALVSIIALAVGVFVVRPLFHLPWYESHDMVAYPVRAIEYFAAWRSGALWPRWAPDLYGGYGCALFNFYAPGLFIVTGLFMLIGASATAALKIALVLFTAVGFAGMFGLVYGESRRADAALVAAAVFVFFGYHETLIFIRGDLAEYCALALAPLSMCAYRAMGRVAPQRLLAVGITASVLHGATLLVHTLTGQWWTEFLFGIAGWTAYRAWRRGDRARSLAIAVAFVCACGMTAIYSVPALLDRPLVHIERMIHGGLATARNFAEPRYFPNRGFFYVGWAVEWLPLFVVAALVRRRRLLPDVIVWSILTALMFLLMLRVSEPIWHWLPFGAYIQFPWRLLCFVSLFGALAIGACWRWLIPQRRLIAWPLAVVAFTALAWDGTKNMPPDLHAVGAPMLPTSPGEIAHGVHTTVISDEYLPRDVVARPMMPYAAYFVAADRAVVDSSLRSETGYKLEVGADAGATVDVRAFWFPGWKVETRSGPQPVMVGPSPLGLVRLHFPVKGYYRLRVFFGVTPLRAAAAAASLVSIAALVLALWRLRRSAHAALAAS